MVIFYQIIIKTNLIDNESKISFLNWSFYEGKEIIDKNFLVEGLIYIHVSRGIAKRDHNWSNKIKPTLIISAISKNISNKRPKKIALISNNDIRWKKCNIKSVSLLPNVLLKQKAFKNKASECIMFNDKGYLTEATTSNVFIIKQNSNLEFRKLISFSGVRILFIS